MATAGPAVRAVAILPALERVVIYPFVGYELAFPLAKPDSLYGQAVTLSGWRSTSQLVLGATTAFYVFEPNPSEDNLHLFSIDASYVLRQPFVNEPFVTIENVAGTSTALTRLRRNPRPEIEASLVWNVSQFAGLQLQYKYGSLPPVYKLADHQLSLGLTLKAKYASARPALF